MAEKKKTNRHLSLRMNIVFLITFVLFSALIFRLGIIQIVQGEEFLQSAERNHMSSVQVASPRGWIMDRNGQILVNNEPIYTVTYTETPLSSESREETFETLSTYIDMSVDEIGLRYNPQLGAFAPHRIKQDITTAEMFQISEHLDQMPGIGIMLDSTRQYLHGSLFRQFLGQIGPIQVEDLNEFLVRGYARNEIVGTSYLEKQYEEQLRGKPQETEIILDRSRRPIGDPIHTPGQRGNDLVLTIDYGLQQHLETVTKRIVESNDIGEHPMEQPLFVAMDPKTGEVLAMSNNVFTYSVGRYDPGSTVKMASVLMGLHEGIFTPTTQINDSPIMVGSDGSTFSSWTTLGQVDAYRAIQRSSNVYMVQVGLRMGGASPGNWTLNSANTRSTMAKVRGYYNQFGLGDRTGIDLPNEFSALRRDTGFPGHLAQLMFGQYDQYTPLQMATYVSTIANGGYRMQPHLVKEIRKGIPDENHIGETIWRKEPRAVNRIEMSDDHLAVAQRGMELVTEGNGTAVRLFGDFPVKVAAKTGTSQTNRNENHTWLVGYAPADDPQIAFASLAPYSQASRSQGVESISQRLAHDVLQYYFGYTEEIEFEDLDEDIYRIIE